MKLAMLAVLFVVAAQVAPSCGGGEAREIVGWVEEKFERNPRYYIVINHFQYSVPYPFWRDVGVGDLVKFDGTKWTIVKKASEYQ